MSTNQARFRVATMARVLYKAGKLVADSKIARTGLVATRFAAVATAPCLTGFVEDSVVFDAWSDEPWVVDGAAVRVSLICFGTQRPGLVARLNGSEASRINADLTAAVADITRAKRLAANRGVAFIGDLKTGPLDVSGQGEWLRLPIQTAGPTLTS